MAKTAEQIKAEKDAEDRQAAADEAAKAAAAQAASQAGSGLTTTSNIRGDNGPTVSGKDPKDLPLVPTEVLDSTRTPVRQVGDVIAVALKDNNHVRMGNRSYVLLKGKEVLLNPDHAEELQQGGWVVYRR